MIPAFGARLCVFACLFTKTAVCSVLFVECLEVFGSILLDQMQWLSFAYYQAYYYSQFFPVPTCFSCFVTPCNTSFLGEM